MLRIVLCLLLATSTLPSVTHAQGTIYDGFPMDSTLIRFSSGSTSGYIADTATTPLWQAGRTHKSFFTTDTAGVVGMITDTLNPYPANANNWFIIKVSHALTLNPIVDFWHKFQTDTGHAGGIVEFSQDHGMTWQNIKGACNTDSFTLTPGVLTSNFYTFSDTLLTGEPAFTGSSGATQQYSRFQFFWGLPAKTTGASGCHFSIDTFYIRFRFVSDTTTDALAGWEIDSIKLEQDLYTGGIVTNVKEHPSLKAFPNPSYDGLFTFPALTNEQQFSIEVYNAMGVKVIQQAYSNSLDLNGCAKGLYFYKVSDGTEYYTGRLQTE